MEKKDAGFPRISLAPKKTILKTIDILLFFYFCNAHRLECGRAHGVSFVDRIQYVLFPQVLTAVHQCNAVPQLHEYRLGEHQGRGEEIDEVPCEVSAVQQQLLQSVPIDNTNSFHFQYYKIPNDSVVENGEMKRMM